MLADLQDANLRARISWIAGDRYRLVLDYPRDPIYRDRVLKAFASLLLPKPEAPAKKRGRPRKEGAAAE